MICLADSTAAFLISRFSMIVFFIFIEGFLIVAAVGGCIFSGTAFFQHFDLSPAFSKAPLDLKRIAVGIFTGIIHGAPHGHGKRDVILHLLQTPAVAVEKIIHDLHILVNIIKG